MTSYRADQVGEQVREEIMSIIRRDLKDPRIGFVTVTGVETSADLRSARVFVSVLGDDLQRDEALAGLSSARGFLQQRLGEELRMKRTPTLDFVHDDSIRTGMRINELLSGEARPRSTE